MGESIKKFLKSILNNCAYPRGMGGRIIVRLMNIAHAPVTAWGLKRIRFQPYWTMLDIGCGGGATLKRLLKRSAGGTAYGIDISDESVERAKKNNAGLLGKRVFVAKADACSLPYEDSKFELVTAIESVYFWDDLQKGFQEVHRVLKGNGLFAIINETDESMRRYHTKWSEFIDGMNVYSEEELMRCLHHAGFSDIETYHCKPCFHAVIARKSCLGSPWRS